PSPSSRASDRSTALPAALRSEARDEGEGEAEGGRGRDGLGGMMVASIGIAVAALRGMTQWVDDRRQRFQDQAPVRLAAAKAKAGRIKDRAEHESALAAIGNDAAKARAKGRVQSPTEFGRDATKNKGGSKGTFGESGTGSGRGTKTGGGGKNDPGAKGKGKGSTGPDGSGGKGKDGSGGKGKDGSGPGPKSPKSGKSPSSSASSPSLERARRRQERAADKRRAKDQRASDRAAAKLEDWGKGRDRKHGSEDDRQAAKDRIRNGRLEAKAARRDAAREARRQERADAKEDRKARRKAQKAEKDAPAEDAAEPEPKVDLKKNPRAPKGSSTAPPKATSPKPQPGNEGAAPGAEPPGQEAGGPTGAGPGSRSRRTREHQPPPRQEPRADGEWLRPPPGMRVEYKTTLHRTDWEARDRAEKVRAEVLRRRARIVNVSNPSPGLPPGPAAPQTPPASPAPPAPTPSSTSSQAPKNKRKEAIPMPGGPPARSAPPVGNTQFGDSDLTVYDVIDADKDMAEEILAGAEHALQVADRCQRLQAALEGLRAALIAKNVPGVFVGWCTRLMDRAGVVEDKAVAVAAGLPRASEAISLAGDIAAEHDRPVADVVRDMGHTAPAASSYHKE
ncbi:hypothetical protein, partial [Streptomyces benahoarensis]|uniref:hypothetical protein n=1 Tax=Streptomyces benahoarensis TaxID=2595054 RepID=UPI0025541573